MAKSKVQPYTRAIKQLMAEKSRILSKAGAFQQMELAETAQPLWASAASHEERIAPLLDVLGRDLEAALHRVSAASCYEKSGDPSRAVNLYRAALAGPLSDDATRDVQAKLAACLKQLKRENAISDPSNRPRSQELIS